MIGLAYCADCEATTPLTTHGACALCGSNAIQPRGQTPVVLPVPATVDLSLLALNVETVPDVLELS